MKRLGGLWERVISFDNLLRAFRKARRGKRRRPPVAAFELNLETELLALQRDLVAGDYRPGEYRLFAIYERKPRLIAAAPFRDRVVHHALLNVIEPLIDRRFIFDSYACRAGKGVHAAVSRYQGWAQHHAYALKMDVARYFPSIDHDLLKDKLRRLIKDRPVLALLDRIIDSGPPVSPDQSLVYFPGDDLFAPLQRSAGLPIGNLTSQFLANLYLNDFDHWLKEGLCVGPYLRYVDDMVILDDDKARLAEIRARVRDALGRDRLRLHPDKAHVVPVAGGLDLLGYRVFPHHRRLRNDNGWRFVRKLRKFADAYGRGRVDWEDINPSVQSWIGHASHADTLGLRKAIFSRIVFVRGAGRTAASG
jgi:retron-type reverse transcriptase